MRSNEPSPMIRRGRVALFGSGETGRHGRRVHELLLQRHQRPVPVAVVETPAGFQPNSHGLAEKVKAFFEFNLQNFKPQVSIVEARHRGSDPEGTDHPSHAATLAAVDYVFAGAGSPSYAALHLAESALWDAVVQVLARDGSLALASAMALAVSHHTLPVYEIFKVGTELHWLPGLNLFGAVGLDLTVVPHWNNNEGGTELDTSHCYMGEERFNRLREQLPEHTTILTIDEHTACVLDLGSWQASVHGAGSATIQRGGSLQAIPANGTFSLSELESAS